VLAGYGYAALVATRSPVVRRALVTILAFGLLAEYHAPIELSDYANRPSPIYRMLARQPRGVVAEFPVPRSDNLPRDEAEYAYMSTFHWFPLINGYSGVYPPSYLTRIDRMRGFPDAASMLQLRGSGVRYVIVHASAYPPPLFGRLRERIQADGSLTELGSFDDAHGPAVLYELR
jgi:hypothetical protein